MKMYILFGTAVLALIVFAACRSRKPRQITEIFPQAEMLASDAVEQQFMVSFDGHSFWIAFPTHIAPEECKLIFVFSGRGGTGKSNNIGVDAEPEAKQFRQEMLKAGFGFVCAVCDENAWGDMQSTEETLAAAEYCRQCGLNVPPKLDLMGFSMGGLGALMFGIREPEKTAKIVDVFGVTNLDAFYKQGKYTDALGKLTEEERLARSPALHAEKLKDIPVLMIHGLSDTLVEIDNSRNLYEALTREGGSGKLMEIPGYAHNNTILKDSGTEILEFFRQ